MTNTPQPIQTTVGSSTGMKPVVAKLTQDNKEVKIVAAIVVMLATAIAVYWFYSEQSRTEIGNGLSDKAVSAPTAMSGMSGPAVAVSATTASATQDRGTSRRCLFRVWSKPTERRGKNHSSGAGRYPEEAE